MSSIKRILWIDDVAQNRASNLFPEEETRIVTSMDAAIEEISGSHLYDYDTIVLDIDFENGLHDAPKVIEKLSSQIFLSDAQKNNQFIITNGGYLLYLYLLKRGYPSNQIAFLTGNAAIVEQLRAYAKQTERNLSKKDIEIVFSNLWEMYSEDLDLFEGEIEKLPISLGYKQSDFLIDCEQALDEGDSTTLSELISSVNEETELESIENTGDMMIFRFHQANLEAPAYFSKQDNDITGHNKIDAERWLLSLRTSDQVVRWLLLSAGNKIEQLYANSYQLMDQNYNEVYRNSDKGIRSAYKQMFYVLDGLRSGVHKEAYFQAISALLVPYEASPNNIVDNTDHNVDVRVRYLSAWCSKIARNLLAHNRFGATISAKTSIFIVLMAVTTMLTKTQREEFAGWYNNCIETLEEMVPLKPGNYDANNKIRILLEALFNNNEIEIGNKKAKPYNGYSQYNFRDTMYALTNNNAIETSSLTNEEMEDYFLFSLAAGYVRWFFDKSPQNMEANYGPQIVKLYYMAERIVNSYQYPLRQI